MATPRKVTAAVTPLAYSISQACAALGVGETVFRANVLPHLRVVRLGGRVLIPVRDLERYVETNTVVPLVAELAQLARARGAR